MVRRIDYTHCNRTSKELIKQYNTNPVIGKDNKSLICKPGTVHTFNQIVKMMSACFNKNPKLFEDGYFTTNNVAIATYTGYTSRTIQNHMHILVMVGLILKPSSRWHGSKKGYEIALNPILYPTPPKTSNNSSNSGSMVLDSRQNFPHKELETLTKVKDKRNVNKVADQPHKKGVALQIIEKIKRSGNKGDKSRAGNFAVNLVPLNLNLNDKGDKPGRKIKAEKTTALVPSMSVIREYIASLIKICMVDIYKNLDYLTQSQIEVIRVYFDQKFCECTTREQVRMLYGEFSTRLFMVKGWLEDDPKHFIPIPQVYFDRDRKFNFDNTRAWYEAMNDFNNGNEIFRKRRAQHIKKRDKFMFLYKAYQKNLAAW